MSASEEFQALGVAVLTVSDTRDESNDSSGQYLAGALRDAGHRLQDKQIVKDDIYRIRAQVSVWIADADIDVVLTTGGTGFSGRDSTPEAISVLFDKAIDGFGECFRAASYIEIGSSTIQSRALAGLANDTVIFCMPGSTGACKTAWQSLIAEQLNSRHRPCNFVGVLNTRQKHGA